MMGTLTPPRVKSHIIRTNLIGGYLDDFLLFRLPNTSHYVDIRYTRH